MEKNKNCYGFVGNELEPVEFPLCRAWVNVNLCAVDHCGGTILVHFSAIFSIIFDNCHYFGRTLRFFINKGFLVRGRHEWRMGGTMPMKQFVVR